MMPQYQFNLGQGDPILNVRQNPTDYINNINQEIERLEAYKKQMIQIQQVNPMQNNTNNVSLWDTINAEISSLTPEQQQILANDKTYQSIDTELQMMIQTQLINSVKGIIEQSSRGKELLEAQLRNIKDKKSMIVAESNKELEMFKKFQIAVQANPNLTYAEFVKNVK